SHWERRPGEHLVAGVHAEAEPTVRRHDGPHRVPGVTGSAALVVGRLLLEEGLPRPGLPQPRVRAERGLEHEVQEPQAYLVVLRRAERVVEVERAGYLLEVDCPAD